MDINVSYHDWEIKEAGEFKTNYILNWRIPDFIWLMNNQTNRKIEPDYDEDDECDFEVKIQFVGNENDLLEIYFKTPESVFVEPSFYVFTNNKSYTLISKKPYQLVHKNKWQLLGVLFRITLKAEDYVPPTEINKTDSFYFKFQFLVSDSTTNSSNTADLPTEQPCLPVNEKEEDDIPDSCLIDDLSRLLMNTTLSDVTLKSFQSDEFPAHKVILAARSDVLKAHFEHNTVESKTNVIECPFDTNVLKDVLAYIYNDDAPNIDELSGKLLEAAEFYQLNGLKKCCAEALEKNLSVENAIETLELANLYRVTYLKSRTLEFIKDGLAKDITKTEGWKASQSTELVKGVYEYVVQNNFIYKYSIRII